LFGFFSHAGLCRFEIVWGVCAGCWWGDGSRMEHSAIAAPRRRADRIISRQPAHAREPIGVGVLLFCCVLTGLLFDFSNVTPHRFLSPLRVKNTVEALVRHSDHCPPKSGNFSTPIVTVTAINRNVA